MFVDFCQALANGGHNVQAVCHPEFDAISKLAHDKISISPLKVKWDWSPLARKRLEKILTDYSPQVIHSHLCRGSAVAGSVGDKLGIPVIANMHNYVNLKYYKDISHFCPSTEDQKRYLMSKGILEKNITIIPHFSMIPVVEKEIVINSNEPTTLVSFGRFVYKKGFHILLDAVKQLVESGLDIRLVLGGDGPEMKNLRHQAETANLQDRIKFHGWVNNVSDFLAISSYFILPSLDEPFGIVIIEAMARGKVILASKSKGPEEILDSSTAWKFEVNDSLSLAEAIRKAIYNPSESIKKARAAQIKYKSDYSPESIIPAYISLYNKMINQHRDYKYIS